MPFDGTGFPPQPPGRRDAPGGATATVLIVALALALLLTPISLAGLADLARWLDGR